MAREDNNINYSIESKFTDWKPFIDNTQNELNKIEDIGAKAYLDYQLINIFYAKLKAYMSTRWGYVKDKEKIKKELKLIGDTIFSKKYLTELRKSQKQGYNNESFIANQVIILENIFNLIEKIADSLREHKLLYYTEEIEQKEQDERYKGVAV